MALDMAKNWVGKYVNVRTIFTSAIASIVFVLVEGISIVDYGQVALGLCAMVVIYIMHRDHLKNGCIDPAVTDEPQATSNTPVNGLTVTPSTK